MFRCVDNPTAVEGSLWIAGQIYDTGYPLVKTPGHFFYVLWKNFGILSYLCFLNQQFYTLWMMVIVPRIAAVSCLSTTPFMYGIQREGNFRAELLLSDPEEVIRTFSDRRADIALMPAAAVPSLADRRIVTEYCVGGVSAAREALLASDDPYVAAWKPFGKLPCAFALWVAHGDVEPETIEALQHALTYGLERGYEAILSSPFAADPARAYEGLAAFDYIFDNQKDKALKKFWDAGLKVAPRANPG